jgi:hypothetical protein
MTEHGVPTMPEYALVDLHGNYRATRLGYVRHNHLLSARVTVHTAGQHALRSIGRLALLLVLTGVPLFVALGNPALITLAVTIAVIGWVASLLQPAQEVIAEYDLLLEDRADAHEEAYDWIVQTLAARQSPWRARTSTVGEMPVLRLVAGQDRGMVFVQPLGVDLFVSWTVWRSRSPALLIGHMFRDLVQPALTATVHASLTAARCEVLHSVVREGVQAAILHPVKPETVDDLPPPDRTTGPVVSSATQFQTPPELS